MKMLRVSLWALALFLAANAAIAQSPEMQDSVWGPTTSFLSLAGGTLTGALLLPAGTVGSPSVAFSADADGTGTGFYRAGGNSIGVAANGVLAFSFDTGGLNVSNGYFIYADGSNNAATPGVAFQGDGNTGIDNPGADTIDVIAGGAKGITVGTTGMTLSVIPQADLAVGSCTTGQLRLDTGGATVELCYCNSTNNWSCWTRTTNNGPAD